MNQLDLFRNAKLTDAQKQTIEACMMLAFEAGKWVGQVELEEHIDREQFALAAIESVYSRNNSMPMHKESQSRQATINLRSEKWRDGVRRSSDEYLKTAVNIFCKFLEN